LSINKVKNNTAFFLKENYLNHLLAVGQPPTAARE